MERRYKSEVKAFLHLYKETAFYEYSKNFDREYANNLNGSTTLVLIDGKQLAEYIYDFGLGMQIEQTIEIKKLDADFWDSMKDAE